MKAGILNNTNTHTTDVSVEDLENILTEMLAKPKNPVLMSCGVDVIMNLDDKTFIGWTEGLLPQLQVICGLPGLRHIEKRKKDLLSKKERNDR